MLKVILTYLLVVQDQNIFKMKNIIPFLLLYFFCAVEGWAQVTISPDGFTSCPSTSISCYGNTYSGNSTVRMKVTNVTFTNGGQTKISFVLEKCPSSQGGSNTFTTDGTFKISDGLCGFSFPTTSFQAGVSQVLLDIYVDNFTTGTKTFYGYLGSANGGKFWANSVQITINQPPTTPRNPTPVDGAIGQSTSPTLSWTSTDPEGGSLGNNVNYGTSPTNLNLLAVGSGTSVALTGLTAGIPYYWRVTMYDNKNAPTIGPIWSFATKAPNQPPTTPINPIPSNAATGISIAPTLSWSSSDPEGGTLGYELYLGTSTSNMPLYSTTSTSLSGLATNTTYYWRVIVYDNQGTPTSGPIWSFKTQLANQPSTTPTTPIPSNAATGVSIAPTLSWSSSDPEGSSLGYDLFLGTSTSNMPLYSTGSGTSKSISGLTLGTTYYWKVIAYDSQNASSAGPIWSFTTTATTSPSISSVTLSPTSAALGSTQTINWTNPNNGGTTVNIELLNTSGVVVKTIASNTANDGSEIWTVAGVAAGTYTIKVSSISTPSNAATSANFTITANTSQNIVVTSPNTTGISFAAGSTQSITWTSTGIIGNFKVELITTSNSTGTVLNGNATSPYSWNIGATQVQGANYKIRVTSLQTPSVFDESDNTFTITNPNQASCTCNTITNPSSGEEKAAAAYLCQRCIIDNPSNGDVLPTTNINKQDLAKIMYKALLGTSTLPAQYSFINNVIEKYPTPYSDINGSNEYQKYGRVLLYLEYGDGVSPFTRNNLFYNPTGTVTRAQVCKVICETFNLTLSASQISPYSDVTSSTEEFKYIRTCYDKGINNSATSFNPTQACSRSQAFTMLYRYLNGNGSAYPPNIPPSVAQSDFALPDNFTPSNMNNSLGVSDGVFDDYSETSFSIPDKQMALVFAHSYSSNLAWMPDEFFGFTKDNGATQPSVFYNMRPFNNGWTHNFNAYIKKVVYNTSATTKDSVLVVCWSDGSFNYYQYNASFTKLTTGLFDNFSANGTTGFIIKKKDQVEYYFTKISGTDVNAPYMLTAIKDRNTNQMTLNYEVISGAAPRLTNVQAPSGRKLTFTYDGVTHRVKTVTDPLSRVVYFTYSGLEGTLASYKDADGFETKYFYNEENIFGLTYFLTSVRRPKGNQITNSYDAKRKLKSTTVNNNGVSYTRTVNYQQTYGATAISGTTSSVQTNDGNNTYTTSVSKNANGDISNITTPTIPSGAVVLYNDPMYPTLPTTVSANGVTTKYEYSQDQKANVTKVIQDQGGLNYTHTITYNALNDVLTYQNPRLKTTTFVYGDGKNLTSVQRPIGTTNITYLSGGLVDIITNPEGIQTKMEYDAFSSVKKTTVSGSGITISTSAEYDAASRMIRSYDGNGKMTQFEYNNRDLPTKETNPLNYNTQFNYDNNGNLTHITNAKNNVTQMEYDALDQVISEQFGNSKKQYQYFNDGKLKKIIKPDGKELNYAYNTDDGLLNSDGYATFGYDTRKRLQTVTRNSKAIAYGYDNLDRVSTITYDGQTVGYTYDENNNVKTVTYPGSKVVTYTYDDNDRLQSVKDWNNQTTNYTYKLDDRLNTTQYPNGIVSTYTYDGIGRMTGILTQKTGSPAIYAHNFVNDNNGNHVLESKTDPINTYPSVPTANIAYTYNEQNRIQFAGNTQFSFDANGNTQAKSGSSYVWDDHDMLTNVNGSSFTAAYEYDGLGNRRRAVRNGVATKYVLNILGMSQILMETNDAGTVQNYYVYGLGLISRIKPDNTTRYYHGDFRGSTVAMTDASAVITHKYQYDEFGTVLQKVEQDENRFRYVGLHGVMHEDSLLYFMRARYYDAEVGRFLSEDPVWSVNLYAYAENNPLKYNDPKGTVVTGNVEAVYKTLSYVDMMYEAVGKEFLPKGVDIIVTSIIVPIKVMQSAVDGNGHEVLKEAILYIPKVIVSVTMPGPGGMLAENLIEATYEDVCNISKYGFKKFSDDKNLQSNYFYYSQKAGSGLENFWSDLFTGQLNQKFEGFLKKNIGQSETEIKKDIKSSWKKVKKKFWEFYKTIFS